MASGAVSTGKSAWSQLDGLLTCAICLDRYRNPKLLPCQHTFCMEPCLEGLIDYVRRQIKCPECRAEHRIPYQGIQGYPTNVTLMRFLELHFAVTGEEPDTSPTVMERCAVCSEKSYLTHCGHCDKKACTECKEAHLDILKREISRINNQVRRGLHRLQEALDQADKTSQQFQTNCTRVLDDIGDTSRRLQKAVKDREESLRSQVQNFLQNELKTATQMKEGLETEVSNIQSNCELIETHVTENSDWEDVELVDYKEIFLKTIEFLRSFDPETSDFNRRLKFTMGPGDPDALHHSVANFGDLTINATQFGSTATPLGQGGVNAGGVTGGGSTGGGMLMRSKSDHRLASQFQRNEEIRMSSSYLGLAQRENDSRDGRTSPLSSRRRAGEYGDSGPGSRRGAAREADDVERGNYSSQRRYNYTSDGRNNKDRGDREDADGGYRSRFTGEILRDSSDSDLHSSRSVRFARPTEQEPASVTAAPPRERVFETEDATRGPLSGIARLMDSPRVMERLQQNEQRRKLKEIKDQQPPPPAPAPQQTQAVLPSRPRAGRQVSEDDEIAKIKAQNKGQETVVVSAAATAVMTVAAVTTTTATTTTPQPLPLAESTTTRPVTRRVAALQNKEDNTRGVGRRSGGDERPPSREGSGDGYESASSRPPSRQSTASDTKDAGKSASDRQAGEDDKSTQPRRTYGSSKSHATTSSAIAETASESDSDAKTSQEGSSTSSSPGGSDTGVPLNAADDASGQEKPNYFRFRTAAYSRTPSNSSVNLNSPDSPDESPLSPPLGRPSAIDAVKSTDSSSAGSPEASPRRVAPATVREDRKPESPDPAQRRTTAQDSRLLGTQGRSSSLDKSDVTFERPKPRFTSRFLPRTSSLKESDDVPHSARNPHPIDSDTESSCSDSDDDKAKDSRVGAGGTPRHSVSSVTMSTRSATDADVTAILTRSALARKENAAHVSRDRDRQEASSASSYGRLYGRDRDQDSKKTAGSRTSGSSRYDSTDAGATEGSRYGRYLSRSKSSATVGVEEAGSGGGGGGGGSGIGTDRYGKKDYGSSRYAGGSAAASLRRSRLARSRSSHDLHPDDEDEDHHHHHHHDDDEPSLSSSRSSRFERPSDYSLSRSRSHHALSSPRDSPREQSPDDTGRSGGDSSGLSPWARYLRNKYGSRSRENSKDGGSSTATSSRSIGKSRTASNLYSREASSESSDDERGGGGTSHDSSSHRHSPTVSHSSGYAGLNSSPRSAYSQKRRLVMKIGSRGSEPGCFTWPRGIAVGPENSVVVADSSNHRVQVFDHQGGFCKEFGCYGSAEGEFDCLAGVAVNRIGQFIVSDRYNHRIQVFDPSGRFLRSFGSQGTGDGRLSYPWGIATDSLGFIYVCDKENHRVQVFQSDGTFVGKFGTLGSKTGQLEHPHYVAVSNTNKVIVSDSNNHRVQVFDVNGRVLSSFGSEGSDDGQFKFPRGVAVDDQGYIIVGDSGNNRIQIFNPDGSFLKAFGTWGSADGEFKGLEGIAVASNGNILVCDRENHRIQVF